MLQAPPDAMSGGALRSIFMKRIFTLFISFMACLWAMASSPKYIALSDSADNFIKKERWADAEKTILAALKLEPANFLNSMLLSNLGVVRTNMGRNEEAIEAFGLGISIAPRSATIRANRARTYLAMGNYDNALSDLDKALEIDSLHEWSLRMRGYLRLRNNDLEGASRDFTELKNHFPKNAGALSGLAGIAEAEGKFQEALGLYNQALDIEEDPVTRFSRILLKINMQKYSEASEDISESIRKYPEMPDFYLARGYLHHLNYRNDEAEIDKKIALDKGADPQFVEKFFPSTGR